MAIKDYANKKRRKVGNRTSRYNSDRAASNVLRANRSNRGHSGGIMSSPLFTMVIFIGIIFGGAIIYLEYFQDIADNLWKTASNSHQTAKTVQRKATSSKPIVVAEKKPKFEFYHTLPKMSVASNKITSPIQSTSSSPITSAPANSQADKPQEQVPNSLAKYEIDSIPELLQQQDKPKGSPTAKKEQYFLQIASFKSIKDAEALKAKLTLAGFTVSIQSAKLPNGEVWHRVKSNKIQNIELALNLHSQLKVHQIESIILTDKG